MKATLQNLGSLVREKRGDQGLRAAAKEVGTSAPTLSRIEAGKMPDLHTFGKLCKWLEVDPGMLLGMSGSELKPRRDTIATAHLKAKKEIAPETAAALARAIIRAQSMIADPPGIDSGTGV